MKVIGTRTVSVAELNTNLFVRKELDQNHAIYLGELIENGVKMKDPIEVTDRGGIQNHVVDGRHRAEGYELAKVKEVTVKVLSFDSEEEMIAYAYRANTGGSLPPTVADTEHTVMLLVDRNKTIKDISDFLGLPAGMTRKLISNVKSKMARQTLMKAVFAVTDEGFSAPKAAEKYGVDLDKVKEVLSGRRRKKSEVGVAGTRRLLTKMYTSISQKNAALLRNLIEKHEDADVSKAEVQEIFAHVDKLHRQSYRRIKDWRKRFESANGKTDKARP